MERAGEVILLPADVAHLTVNFADTVSTSVGVDLASNGDSIIDGGRIGGVSQDLRGEEPGLAQLGAQEVGVTLVVALFAIWALLFVGFKRWVGLLRKMIVRGQGSSRRES